MSQRNSEKRTNSERVSDKFGQRRMFSNRFGKGSDTFDKFGKLHTTSKRIRTISDTFERFRTDSKRFRTSSKQIRTNLKDYTELCINSKKFEIISNFEQIQPNSKSNKLLKIGPAKSYGIETNIAYDRMISKAKY